jgi:hypothetical protein
MTSFVLSEYLADIRSKIHAIMSRPSSETLTYDILDSENIKHSKLIALQVKQRQMRIGNIWQIIIGNYDQMFDLGVGHETGLDIMSTERKLVMELKNRTNTDNASSKLSNLNKLAKYKRQHPDYEAIYGCVNDDTHNKTMGGEIVTFMHDGVELKKYTGMKLLNHIFGANVQMIVECVKESLDGAGT